jgi:hypothetical protein
MKSEDVWIRDGKWFACGANASLTTGWLAWKSGHDRDVPGLFPPEVVVQVKALACEPPRLSNVPLSRWSTEELARHVQRTGWVATISGSTVWRWLDEDAIRPWQHRCWIYPRDPFFAEKAGRILDLYAAALQAITHVYRNRDRNLGCALDVRRGAGMPARP